MSSTRILRIINAGPKSPNTCFLGSSSEHRIGIGRCQVVRDEGCTRRKNAGLEERRQRKLLVLRGRLPQRVCSTAMAPTVLTLFRILSCNVIGISQTPEILCAKSQNLATGRQFGSIRGLRLRLIPSSRYLGSNIFVRDYLAVPIFHSGGGVRPKSPAHFSSVPKYPRTAADPGKR